MTLKTNYKDYQFQEGETLRKYQEISNDDGTISFRDVTSYQQEGDRFSASDINSTNAKVNKLDQTVGGIQTDVSGLQTDVSELQTKSFEGTSGTIETKGGYLHDMMIFGKSAQKGTPTPDNPIEIQSVVNPKVTVCGKNLLDLKGWLDSNGAAYEVLSDNSIDLQLQTNLFTTPFTFSNNDIDITLSVEFIKNKTSANARIDVVDKNGNNVNSLFSTDNYKSLQCKGSKIRFNWSSQGTINFKNLQIELGSTATEYEPYKGQSSATLPYTLNAIPVSSGGNVTIDGQQYISDYVDIENKKLVKYLAKVDVSGTFENTSGNTNFRVKNQFTDRMLYDDSITNLKCSHFKNGTNISQVEHCRWVSQSSYYFGIHSDKTLDEINALTDLYIMYPLAAPTITTITDEEVSQFKALKTYEPTTNIIASSDALNPLVKCDYSLNKETNNIYDRLQENATRLNGLSFVALTQTEYDALSTKDNNTIYFITEG